MRAQEHSLTCRTRLILVAIEMTEGATIPSPTLGRFGGALVAAGYTEEGLAHLLGIDAVPTTIGEAQQEIFRRRLSTRYGEELVTLALCLLLGEPVAERALALALPGVDIDELKESGLLSANNGDSDTVRAAFVITPWEGMLLAHDAYVSRGVATEHVTGVTAATKTLARLTLRREALSSLDIGSGCGAQALLLARHSGRVVATDVNRRALFLTALNAGLNSVPNVHTRLGSLFEPVAGERFDLIACNPPYVISPESALIFRDSGLPGDAISREVVQNIGDYLGEGGFATVMCNWAVPSGKEWYDPLLEWLVESTCNAWLLHYRTEDTSAYARKWNLPLEWRDPAAFASSLEEWSAYYDRNGITAIASGAVILQSNSSGKNWRRWSTMADGPFGHATDHLLRTFSNINFLHSVSNDEELLSRTFSFVGRHSLDQRIAYGSGTHQVVGTTLRSSEGVGVNVSIEPAMVHLLFRLEGRKPVRDIATEVAESLGGEARAVEESCLRTIRTLLENGLLAPLP